MNKISRKIILYLIIFLISAIFIFGILYKKISTLEYTPIPEQYELDIEKVIIQPGDVLALVFAQTRLSSQDSGAILQELRKYMKLSRCMPNDFFEILYSKDTGEWTHFWYYPSGSDFYSLKKLPDGQIVSSKKSLPITSEEVFATGTIETSLWEAMAAQNIPADLILSFADIFAWKMDFLTDTRKDDTFKVIYNVKTVSKKNTAVSSDIIAAQYKTGSTTYNAIYFTTNRGTSGFFDEEGSSVKSAFLKAPLQFRRISSHFTTARRHPILKYVRPHLGIDYAAPTGTPVSSIADGTVTKAQYNGGFGHYVEIRHANGYVTSYGHLSKYGRGIKRGVRVSQGQIIGYVGSTGLSTGPHLDFRIKKNGRFFNFLTMKQPPTTKLHGEDKTNFLNYAETVLKRLNEEQ